jgi:hypothetical protein
MASAELSRRVGQVVGYPPLAEMSDLQRREFHEALLDVDAADAGQRPRPVGHIGRKPAALESGPGGELYAALHDGTIKRSDDHGRTWSVRAAS